MPAVSDASRDEGKLCQPAGDVVINRAACRYAKYTSYLLYFEVLFYLRSRELVPSRSREVEPLEVSEIF